MKCIRKDCESGKLANWWPVLLFYAPGTNIAARGEFEDLRFCTPCKYKIVVADLMDDSGWESIRDGFRSLDRVDPDRDRTKIEWQWAGKEV